MIKIMSLNINYYGAGFGPWEQRIRIIKEAVLAANPDILALQAVRKEPGRHADLDQARQLASLLSDFQTVVFEPAEEQPDWSVNGSAILSRFRIARSDRLPLDVLPGLDDTNRRTVMQASFDLPGGQLILFNAHLSWVPEQIQANLDQLLPYLDSFGGPGVLVGDLNATPESAAMQRLRDHGWTDAWALLHPGDPGYTFIEGGRFSKRIDYAWVNQELAGRLRSIAVLAGESHPDGMRVSDHAGLLLTLA